MEYRYYTSSVLCYFTALSFLLHSCVYPIYEPYTVPEQRQKQNIYYVPSAHHAPLLQEKDDFQSSVMTSLAGKQFLLEFQGAYLASKHVGFCLNYSGLAEGDKLTKFNRLELGTGYVLSLSNKWLFETYGGWGTGKIKNLHETGSSFIKSNHLFLQPAIAVSNKKRTTQLAFVSKFTRMNFAHVDTYFDSAREPFSLSQVNRLQLEPIQIFWEPGLILRFGWQQFLFHSSFTVSKNLSNRNLSQARSNLSLGMTMRFARSSKPVGPTSAASLPRIE
jgi:hypothetical protein